MSEMLIGVSFATLPMVVFFVSATADRFLKRFGRRTVFATGCLIVCAFTALLGAGTLLPDGVVFTCFTLSVQLLQGFGSALVETASFALVSELYPQRITFYLGLLEAFTGVGVVIGPPVGGLLYSLLHLSGFAGDLA